MNKIKTNKELRKIILESKIPLETLDISLVKDMSNIFNGIYNIKGSISGWDANERIINNSLLIVNEDKR